MRVSRFLFIFCIALISCERELPDLSLPEKTNEGKDTFGCLLNKAVWSNYGKRCHTFGCDTTNLSSDIYKSLSGNTELTIRASYTVGKPHFMYEDVILIVTQFSGEGTYDLADGYMQFYRGDEFYRSKDSNTAFLRVTNYDSTAHIISGEFYGILPNTNTTVADKVEIAEGRFDIPYAKLY